MKNRAITAMVSSAMVNSVAIIDVLFILIENDLYPYGTIHELTRPGVKKNLKQKEKNSSKSLSNWEIVWSVFRYALPYKWFWAGLFILSLIMIGIGLVDPLIIQFLLDEILLDKSYALLPLVILVFAAAKMLSLTFSYLYGTGYAKFTQNIFFDIRNDIFSRLQHKRIGYFSQKEVGDLIRTLMTDVQRTHRLIRIGETVFTNIIRLIVIIAIVLAFDWKFAVLALIFVPLYAFVQATYIGKIKKEAEETVRTNVSLYNFFEERLSNIMLVKLFSNESREAVSQRKLGKEYAEQTVRLTSISLLVTSLIGLISGAAVIVVLWIGAQSVISGALTVGGLIAVYTYMTQLFSPVSSLASVPTSAQDAIVAGRRVFNTISAPEEPARRPGELKLNKLKGRIIFDRVTFAYPERPNRSIFKDLSLEISPTETVGIVGASGVGKSTLIRLLLRFYYPQKGKILLDGHNLQSISRRTLRSHIGVVPQENLFLPGTVKDNLVYGNQVADMDQIFSAAKSVGIHKRILELENDYGTMLGPEGGPLSAGERQRLAIARAIIFDPDIFIFDQSTAELDASTERVVKKTIEDLSRNRTSIVIAHRFSALDFVDRILVLKNESIIEQGSFDGLLNNRGEFYRLHNLQQRKRKNS